MARMRVWLWSTLHRWFPTSAANAYCSFCGRGREDAGPFVEGVVGSMICEHCVRTSVDLFANRDANGNRSLAPPKAFDHHGLINRVLMANLVVFFIAVVAASDPLPKS